MPAPLLRALAIVGAPFGPLDAPAFGFAVFFGPTLTPSVGLAALLFAAADFRPLPASLLRALAIVGAPFGPLDAPAFRLAVFFGPTLAPLVGLAALPVAVLAAFGVSTSASLLRALLSPLVARRMAFPPGLLALLPGCLTQSSPLGPRLFLGVSIGAGFATIGTVVGQRGDRQRAGGERDDREAGDALAKQSTKRAPNRTARRLNGGDHPLVLY